MTDTTRSHARSFLPSSRLRLSRAALRPPLKRALDVVGAALLLLLAAPVFLIIVAGIVKLSD